MTIKRHWKDKGRGNKVHEKYFKMYLLTYYNILENYHILLLFYVVKITLYIFNNF